MRESVERYKGRIGALILPFMMILNYLLGLSSNVLTK